MTPRRHAIPDELYSPSCVVKDFVRYGARRLARLSSPKQVNTPSCRQAYSIDTLVCTYGVYINYYTHAVMQNLSALLAAMKIMYNHVKKIYINKCKKQLKL